MKRTLLVLGMVLALAMTAMANVEPTTVDAGITSPMAGEVIYENTLELRASEPSANLEEEAAWAVRSAKDNPTCRTSQPDLAGWRGPQAGAARWVDGYFSAEIDVSTWEAGEYCFAFNPYPYGDFRDTVFFYIADGRVSGGGQILYGDYKVSFGGEAYAIEDVSGDDIDGLGSWTVRFHEVSTEGSSKTTFDGDYVYDMNFFPGGAIANFKVDGTWDGNPGSTYTLIVRAEDQGEPGGTDNLRFQLLEVYDTYVSGDFPGESETFGTARTNLDRGNLQVDTR